MTVLDDIAATISTDTQSGVGSPYLWVPSGGGGGVVVAGTLLVIGGGSVGSDYVPASPWRLRGSLDPHTYAHVISLFYDEAAPGTPDNVHVIWSGGGGGHDVLSAAVTVPATSTTPVQTAFDINATPTLTSPPADGHVGIVCIVDDSGGLSSTAPSGWQYLGGVAGNVAFFGRIHSGDGTSLPFGISAVGHTSTLGYSEWLVVPPITPCFTPSSTTITEGDTVHFTDCTTGGTVTAWAWTFGDGGTSSSQNPSHQYVSHGTYTVTLTVTIGGVDYSTTGVVHAQADVGYTPSPPGLALVEIYVTSPGSARWDEANWDEAVWSSDSWQNVTPEATDVQIIWGSQRPELGILSTPDAASWGIGFYDPGRILDPANEASPFFGDIVPGLPVRITHKGWVVKQGILESAGHNFDLNDFKSHNAGYFRVTDSQSLMARSKVPSDTTLGDNLYDRARDAIAAAGLSIAVAPETFAAFTPGGEVLPIGHVHDLVPWVSGTDWSVWQWVSDAAAQVLHVPYIDRTGRLGFRPWGNPKDYAKEIASPNLVGLGSVIFQNGTYSVVKVLDDDGVTLVTRELTPKPYYGAVTYDDRATKPTPNASDWADAVLADRAVAGLRWVPGEVFPLTAQDVRYFAEIEAIERVSIDYVEANPPISVTGIVVGGQIVITPVQEREARWSFLFQVAATADQPLVDDDDAASFLVNDDDLTDYLYPG